MPASSTCSALDPLQSGFVPWSTLYPVDKVPVPTRLDLDATYLAEDVEDPADDAEDPRDGFEALVDDGEALNGLEKH